MNLFEDLEIAISVDAVRAASASGAEVSAGLMRLPESHRSVLRRTNGLIAYGGYYRLFGTGEATFRDISDWNDEQRWKFAWKGKADGFLAFADTAFGDQYAYRESELGSHKIHVYYLHAETLDAEKVADSFEEFMSLEFLLNSSDPSDEFIIGARRVYGDISPSEAYVFSPPPILSGKEDLDKVMRLDASTVMTLNGDICTQFRLSGDRLPRRVVPYVDDEGRSRLRLEY